MNFKLARLSTNDIRSSHSSLLCLTLTLLIPLDKPVQNGLSNSAEMACLTLDAVRVRKQAKPARLVCNPFERPAAQNSLTHPQIS